MSNASAGVFVSDVPHCLLGGDVPLDFISAVQACTNSSTSSGTTVLLFQVDCHRGRCGAGCPAAGAFWFFAGCAPLFLKREKSGMVLSVSYRSCGHGWRSVGKGKGVGDVVSGGKQKEWPWQ